MATLALSGASGLIGARLLRELLEAGNDVRALLRGAHRTLPSQAKAMGWDGIEPPLDALAGADAIVHLSGEPIFGGLLTQARRRRIYASRVDSTRAFAAALAALPEAERPRTLVCASAVGIYRSQGDQMLDEDAAQGDGFLSVVCRDWEAAAARAQDSGVRVVSLRIGVVLAGEGGALPNIARLFRLGLGGRLGSGRQWFPWIHASDVVRLVRFALDNDELAGAVNAVSPEPVTNSEFTERLGAVLNRPTFLSVPEFVLRRALGELSGELLDSRRVTPRRAQQAGFEFHVPGLLEALEKELRG